MKCRTETKRVLTMQLRMNFFLFFKMQMQATNYSIQIKLEMKAEFFSKQSNLFWLAKEAIFSKLFFLYFLLWQPEN